MTTVKVKLRQSKKDCLSGTVYYQMYHHGKMQQVSSAIHIPPVYWDAYSNSIYGIHLSRDPSLRVFQNQINNDMKLIRTIILEFETSGSTFTVNDVANQFRDIRRHTLFLEYFKSQIDSLARNEKYGTARNHNIPLSVISAGMGHSSEKTTQIYLDSLENSILDQANRHILASLEV